jgi:hypothetical protein
MRTEIITVKIPIAKQGMQAYFTVNLPKDLLYVEKVETGILGVSAAEVAGNIAGTLQLQGVCPPNLCFATDVLCANSVLDNQLTGFVDSVTDDQQMVFATLPYVAAHKQHAGEIRLADNHQLYGCYEDVAGVQSGADISYTIGVYLHLVINS